MQHTPTLALIMRAVLTSRGVQALLLYRLARRCYIRRLPFLANSLSRICQLLFTVDISYEAEIDGGVTLRHPQDIVIGRQAKVHRGVLVFNGVTLGAQLSTAANHPDGMPEIGDGTTIGTGAKVLGPIEIGRNAVIGANVVVTKSVQDQTVVTR